MKRNILFFIFVVSFSTLSAQNVIDTIIDTARYYYYYQWQGYNSRPSCEDCYTEDSTHFISEFSGAADPNVTPHAYMDRTTTYECDGQLTYAECATRFYTDHPLRVTGIAVGLAYEMLTESDGYDINQGFETRLWVPQGDSLKLIATAWVGPNDLARWHHSTRRACTDSNSILDHDDYTCMYESHFDKEVTVMDTFYIGVKARMDGKDMPPFEFFYVEGHINYTLYACRREIHRVWRKCERGPWLDQYDHPNNDGSPSGILYYLWLGANQFLFPIIIPEPFHCPEVQNIRVTSQTATTTIVEWNAHDHHAYYEYVYGVEGSDPDTLPVLYVTDTLTGLFNLDSNTRYQCWVRAVCEVDSTYRSAWSNPITVWMGIFDTTQNGNDTTGILLPSDHDTRVVLSPNPATTRLDIASEVTMQHVEIYNLHGKTFYEQAIPTTHLTVNLDGWPAGGYMVRIQTADGTVMKKLIVRR